MPSQSEFAISVQFSHFDSEIIRVILLVDSLSSLFGVDDGQHLPTLTLLLSDEKQVCYWNIRRQN
ncbi:25836_t:CDS:2 [Gigaspora rosea]|nr:25836_t:CDS:2 [Gigaspora rosea]